VKAQITSLFLAAVLLLGSHQALAADALPNLTASVAVTVRNLGPNAEVTFDISLQNAGNANCSKPLYVDLWSQYSCACNVNPLKCAGVGSSDFTWEFKTPAVELKAGTTTKLSFKRTMAFQAIPYRYLLSIDSYPEGGTCVEGKKLDNLVCGDYKVEGSGAAPDLVVSDCQVVPKPENPTVLLVSATVSNQGTAATPTATGVDIFLEEAPGAPAWSTRAASALAMPRSRPVWRQATPCRSRMRSPTCPPVPTPPPCW
jgi:hypothetical protein